MSRKKMCEIDGKQYVIPSVFADEIQWNTQQVTHACGDGRIIGACKDSSGRWIIPVNTFKPLTTEEIRQLMILTVYLKNYPNSVIDRTDHDNIVKTYSYLQQTGYIGPFDINSDRIPYEVIMTEKGLKMATEGEHIKIDWLKTGGFIIQTAASVITIIQFL